MAPILVFRFSPGDDPGHFGAWLDAQGLAWHLVSLHDGEPVPVDATGVAGIGMMGGPMSVNDPLPWIAPLESLIRDAIAREVPVIGHCLGGQLMAKALGAKVGRAQTAEIGWIDVEVPQTEEAREWFGSTRTFTTFEWHYETFALPPGATRVLTNRFNTEQAYVVDGRHIGFQCHIEMTAELARSWVRMSGDELPAESTVSMHNRRELLEGIEARAAALNRVADTVYARWARNLETRSRSFKG